MVFTASQAGLYTSNSITVNENLNVQREVDLTERAIRSAARLKKYAIEFNALTIGNPIGDPMDSNTNLSSEQVAYRDAMIAAGYQLGKHGVSGYWTITWASQGIETSVNVYSVRTTVTIGPISASTITYLSDYFKNQKISDYANISAITTNGGDINEADFGATASTFYEYVIVIKQQDKTVDLSTDIVGALAGSSYGYTTTNTSVYKLV